MKLIVLIESNWKQFEDISDKVVVEKSVILLNTDCCNEDEEYDVISNSIKTFVNSEIEIMLIKYSGRDNIAQSLGDIFPQMIIPVSYNETSLNYIEHPVETFLELVTILEKENIDKW